MTFDGSLFYLFMCVSGWTTLTTAPCHYTFGYTTYLLEYNSTQVCIFSCSRKSPYQTESHRLHVMLSVRIWTTAGYLCFSHVGGGGRVNIAQANYYLHTPLRRYTTDNNQNRDIKYDTHAICILKKCLDRQFRVDEQNLCWILSVNKENVITF
jgi:transcriptional regulator CtsR